MADPKDDAPQNPDAPRDSGSAGQPRASTTARVVRESDLVRTGIDADLTDVATGLVTLRVRGVIQVNEQIKIRLQNVVQRFEKEVRGAVRAAARQPDGTTLAAIDLFQRLTPLEVSLLKMGIASRDARSESKWL